MQDERSRVGRASQGPRGLASCAQCQGIFPGARLTNAGGRFLCMDCVVKFGPPGAAVPPAAPSSLGAAYDARMVRTSSPGPAGGAASFVGASRTPPRPFDPAGATQSFGPAGTLRIPGAPGASSDVVREALGVREFRGAHHPRPIRPPTPGTMVFGAPPGAAPGRTSSTSGDAPPRPNLQRDSFPTGVYPAIPRPPVDPDAEVAAAFTGVARTSFVAGGAPYAAPAPAAPQDRFAEYAELRRRIDAGEDTLSLRRMAAEIAARNGMHLEAVEHYRRCVEISPRDERLRMMLENVERAVGIGRGEPTTAPTGPSRRLVEEDPPFWEGLGTAIGYPFRGAGLPVLLVGGLLLGIGQLVGSFNLFAWAVNVMLWGYVAAYLFDVINSSAAGKSAPPELPEAANVLESYVFPFFSFLACVAISFAPFLLVGAAVQFGWFGGLVSVVLLLALFALGVFALPMTLLVRAMFQSLGEAAQPALVLGSIGRILPDYVAMFVATCVLWVSFGAAYAVTWFACWATLGAPTSDAFLHLDGIRVLSWAFFTIVTWPLFLFTWMLQGHLLGRLYRQGLRRLAWFAPETDASLRARRMSVGLAIGAAAALALLCGAAYLTSQVIDRWRTSPASLGLGVECPVGEGSRLLYYWEHTDGAAGLTEYRFSGQADGTLRVTAAVRIAGEGGSPVAETIGIMDPDTGRFTDVKPVWGDGVEYHGRVDEHVPWYGPKKSAVGSIYLNDWSVRGASKWRDVWTCWRVHHERTTADLFYDTRTGILVGSKLPGVGYQVTSWLVEAHGAGAVENGPPPNRNFEDPQESGGEDW